MCEALAAADTKLRAARVAIIERDRLLLKRTLVTTDLHEAEERLAHFAQHLAREARDVTRYERGVWAFLYDVFANRAGRLTKEQQEAAAAKIHHDDAVTLRDRVRDELVAIDRRLVALESADVNLAVARVAKEAVLLATSDARAAPLTAISRELSELDASRVAVDEALVAGTRVHESLSHLVKALESASEWGTVDVVFGDWWSSMVKRGHMDEASSIAGGIQAELASFRRELADVGIQLSAEMTELAHHQRFMDTFFDNIFTDLQVKSRIKEALGSSTGVLHEVATRVEELHARQLEVQRTSEALEAQRTALLDT